jgi:hypothetical protein
VTQDDLLYRFRLRTFAMAGELGDVGAACRAMGIHPSTSYRWKHQLDRYGPEILRPRERRTPRMANATSVLVEQRVVAFALGHPGLWAGPDHRRARPTQVGWDPAVNERRVAGAPPPWPEHPRQALRPGRRLRRSTPAPAAHSAARAAPGRRPPRPARPARLLLHRPAQWHQGHPLAIHRHRRRLGVCLGHPAGHPPQPSATWTSALARTVAADLASLGWRLERVMSDNAQEFP